MRSKFVLFVSFVPFVYWYLLCMEYLDTYNEDGTPTGRKKLRAEVHRDGDWHKTIHAWIMNSKGELLIQLRDPAKETSPSKWDISIAGHISAGSDAIETLVREADEELGLEIRSEDAAYLFTVRQQRSEPERSLVNNELQDVFLIRRDVDIETLRFQDDEVSAVRWIAPEELSRHTSDKDDHFVVHVEEYRRLLEVLRKRVL